MDQRKWIGRAALATVVAAALLTTVARTADAGVRPAAAIPVPPLPSPSLSVSLPPIRPPIKPTPVKPPSIILPPVKPAPAPSSSPPAGQAPPSAGAPTAGGSGSRPGGAAGPGSGAQVAVGPGAAGAIIAADPAADLYPQPPVDAAVTPQARQVAALKDVQHRIQYLHNILARTRDDLARAQRDPDPVLQLLTTLTGPASMSTANGSAPTSALPLAAADPADAVDTPTGRAAALSAAIRSGETELTRRQDEAAALQREISRRVRPMVTTPARPAASTADYAGGRLRRPVPGRLTSNFGVRFDPYYHVWQLHAGVDLATPTGTPIVAAAAGRVTRAGWSGGNGNYTCIDHGTADGQRLSTCYAHQSKFLVSPGQRVRAGQVIGLVGSTGASTGPHLHFEVRLGGRPVNPLPWI